MTDKILCPWCGAEMELLHDYSVGGRYATYWCNKCGAESPSIKQRIRETEEALDKRCFAAALRRYEPPIRPLTLDEVKPGVLKIDEWVEFSNGYVRHIIPDMIDGEYLWDKNDCYYDLRTYGTDWRLWPRRPTEDERKAVEWDD